MNPVTKYLTEIGAKGGAEIQAAFIESMLQRERDKYIPPALLEKLSMMKSGDVKRYLSTIGARGGKATSAAKKKAAKANGKKGGRPRKNVQAHGTAGGGDQPQTH